ncbi:MAG: hypothetical protein MUE91_02070 [Ignavibacteriaceae bacterium]|jgi:MSHA pilin protein MshD|nr:hypothetical protein [Ignavibacteriaceae bacterium]MCU0405674.1 hypothetical protein [Ignavibacteriaceae bacterium]MCU0413180.1 hypothetical protein [Ignavibacteriaceae bacterium]
MTTAQTLLSIGAIMLLTFLILRFNSIQITSSEAAYNAKFGIVANSLANSLIEEAKDKVFDAVVFDTTKTISSPSAFSPTASTNFGPELGEVYPNFDDFDDYHNLFVLDTLSLKNPTTGKATAFEIRSTVDYVNDLTPDVKSVNRTYHKRLTVAVYSNAMVDTVKIATVFSFWTLLE